MQLNYNDFGARYYDADVGRWWSVDPLVGKYRNKTPYNYVLGKPTTLKDPNGKDVVDANDPSHSLSVSEMTNRTKQILKQMNFSANGRFYLDVFTTHRKFRNDLIQTWGGRIVEWNDSIIKNRIGYPRFKVNTMFTLNQRNREKGYYTINSASPSVKLNAALSKQFNKSIFNLKFGATTLDSNGKPIYSDFVVIVTGTIEEINNALSGTGLEIYKTKEDEYSLRKVSKNFNNKEIFK